jgi:integrase
MFATLYNTGGRVSEITGMLVSDVVLDGSAAVRIRGKGRKERSVPLWRTTATEIRKWLARVDGKPTQPLFPGWSGTRMTRPAVTARLQLAVKRAATAYPQLAKHRVSPHIVRHYLPFRTIVRPVGWSSHINIARGQTPPNGGGLAAKVYSRGSDLGVLQFLTEDVFPPEGGWASLRSEIFAPRLRF